MLANMIKSTYSFKIPKSGKLIPLLYIYIYIYKRLEYNAVTFNFFYSCYLLCYLNIHVIKCKFFVYYDFSLK